MLHIGFFTCGVHIAFLVTHLPGEIALCGLPASVSAASIALIGLFNVAGSLVAGALGQRMRMKWILAAMYASRAVMIGIYLLSPPTPITFYIFAAALGFTWLATVPPTAGLVGKLFGPRYLGTLFGLTLLSHQLGGFFGAWLGGVALDVYEEEEGVFFEDLSGQVLLDDELSRLLTFPNVLVTSHQAFLTDEALTESARVTTENVLRFEKGEAFLDGTLVGA